MMTVQTGQDFLFYRHGSDSLLVISCRQLHGAPNMFLQKKRDSFKKTRENDEHLLLRRISMRAILFYDQIR